MDNTLALGETVNIQTGFALTAPLNFVSIISFALIQIPVHMKSLNLHHMLHNTDPEYYYCLAS